MVFNVHLVTFVHDREETLAWSLLPSDIYNYIVLSVFFHRKFYEKKLKMSFIDDYNQPMWMGFIIIHPLPWRINKV